MSEKPIISVKGLGKKYRIRTDAKKRYSTLREDLADTARKLVQGKLWQQKTEDFWALQDINFDIGAGEVVGIIGRNGAGKSTLLKILSRITQPTTGEAILRGRVGSLLEVGAGFHPELTGRENIFMNGTVLGMKRAEIKNKFDEIVAFAGVEKFLEMPVKRYSSGMYVRLAFAVAAHLEPEILLVDEVLAVGDAAFQKKCLGKMEDVAKRDGRTVLFVSHNMAAIQQLCLQAILLKSGLISKVGDVRDVIADYLTLANSQNQEEVPKLFDRRRREDFGVLIRITQCKVFDSSETENYSLQFGEPFVIELECLGLSDLNNVSFVVGIDSATGVRIATSTSQECSCYTTIKKGEPVRTRLKIDSLILNPGNYSITVGVQGGKGQIDHLENARFFEVMTISWNHKSFPNDKWGIVYVEPNWVINYC
ncbi:ABC transporter ATP-binding protein [Microcoleus sp. FACHB-68]|uniref:ABC transporter ATP-binding protein n=1 Tax=Microcoleus sp. FACHB-68 TaxID=2692826 RepID=UPI0016845D0B|nr:ABC transporter ATP-binding protein [Microcoleus sp. FACHB-68]MBD1936507.1 ABC transporter ATP-binding protein [Microcoleus sp. FACHB-68]